MRIIPFLFVVSVMTSQAAAQVPESRDDIDVTARTKSSDEVKLSDVLEKLEKIEKRVNELEGPRAVTKPFSYLDYSQIGGEFVSDTLSARKGSPSTPAKSSDTEATREIAWELFRMNKRLDEMGNKVQIPDGTGPRSPFVFTGPNVVPEPIASPKSPPEAQLLDRIRKLEEVRAKQAVVIAKQSEVIDTLTTQLAKCNDKLEGKP